MGLASSNLKVITTFSSPGDSFLASFLTVSLSSLNDRRRRFSEAAHTQLLVIPWAWQSVAELPLLGVSSVRHGQIMHSGSRILFENVARSNDGERGYKEDCVFEVLRAVTQFWGVVPISCHSYCSSNPSKQWRSSSMVSIRKRRHSGLSPDTTSPPQVYRRSSYPRAAAVPATALNTDKEIPSKQDVNTRFKFAAATPIPSLQELHQLYHASFPEGKELKKRKQQKRKHRENQEPCVMRGVYFKNMKWQAAIKVEKKQVHLGTVDSQEEAAHLYDRAAYLCGREPNFELTNAEKQELQLLQWEDFLEQTRQSILNKRWLLNCGTNRSSYFTSKNNETPKRESVPTEMPVGRLQKLLLLVQPSSAPHNDDH